MKTNAPRCRRLASIARLPALEQSLEGVKVNASVLLVPGINNSGPSHWQSLWEQEHPSFRRIRVRDWDRPVCAEWIEAIDDAVRAADGPLVIVAHSLGCLPLAEWAARAATDVVRGAMFVAIPDPAGPRFPAEATGFGGPPLQRLRFPSIVVSSEDDPFGTPEHARRNATAWGSRFVNVGAAGHINAGSGLGAWEAGLQLLQSLRE